MVFFDKFFKSRPKTAKWQDAEPEVRRQAIGNLRSDAERLDFIRHETDAALRSEALSTLESEDAVEELLHSKQDDVRQSARQHLLTRLLPDNKTLSDITDSQSLIRIAALTSDNEQRIDAINRISDEQQRLQLATEHPVARVRLAAAEGIQQTDKLQQLLDHAQGKDKALYRLAKERLAQQKAGQQQQQARTEAVQQLLIQVRYLNKVGYQPEFNGKLQIINQQWAELAQYADTHTHTEVSQQLLVAATLLTQHAEEEARLAQQQQAAVAAAQQQTALLAELQSLTDNAATTSADELHPQLTALQQHWDNAFRQQKPTPEQARLFENQLQSLFTLHSALQHYRERESVLTEWLNKNPGDDITALNNARRQTEQWLKKLSWPDTVAAPEWLQKLQQRQQDIQHRLLSLQQQQSSFLTSVREQLTRLDTALNDGHLKDATRLSNKIQNALRQLDDNNAAAAQREFRTLTARLHDMRDWAGFATAPKKEQLAVAMEALIDATIAPDLLAEKIHALQEEWKSLGTAAGDNKLWERFQSAGDKAFEPCRAYFASVAEQREKNIGLREQLIAELDSYEQVMDWESADWKVVQKTLDAARDTFRQYSPVERHAHKRTQDTFNAVCDRIYGHLKDEYESNITLKQALVNDAETLASADDLSNAVDQVKLLQAQWKTIGVMPRSVDQKLWKAFRKYCDQVFERLNENKAARQAELNESVNTAEALITQAEMLISGDEPLIDLQTQLDELTSQFAALTLPRSAHQRLLKALKNIEQNLQKRHSQARQQAELVRWDGLIQRLGNMSAADEQWQSACNLALPDGYDSALFNQARAGTLSPSESAQDLCILMEILADIPSPDSDKSQRMTLQVQRLAEGLGKGLNRDQERQSLVERWLHSIADSDQRGRFIAALNATL